MSKLLSMMMSSSGGGTTPRIYRGQEKNSYIKILNTLYYAGQKFTIKMKVKEDNGATSTDGRLINIQNLRNTRLAQAGRQLAWLDGVYWVSGLQLTADQTYWFEFVFNSANSVTTKVSTDGENFSSYNNTIQSMTTSRFAEFYLFGELNDDHWGFKGLIYLDDCKITYMNDGNEVTLFDGATAVENVDFEVHNCTLVTE